MANDDGKLGPEDPMWPYVLCTRLAPYMPFARRWWSEVQDLTPDDTGIYAIEYEDCPPGMFYRFTRTAIRSPIKGIQAFPFVVAGYLQLTGVTGGSTKLIQRLLAQPMPLEEFSLIELHNLPSTYNQGQLIAIVPTEIYENTKLLGRWLYLTMDEISALIQREIPDSVYNKAVLKG